MSVPLDEQIDCVRRELHLMRTMYAYFVARQEMSQAQATQKIAAMEAALKTLEGVRDAHQS